MKALVNQMPNLQILEGLENQGKRDTPFEQWIVPMQQAESTAWADFRERHAIPEMASYGLAHFEAFFAERRALLRKRLAKALNLTTPAAVPEVEQA